MSYVLFFSLLFSIYYRIIFGTGTSGISVVLYVIPFLVCIIYLIKNNNKIKNKEAFIWCIPIALLSFTYLIFNNEFFLRWNRFMPSMQLSGTVGGARFQPSGIVRQYAGFHSQMV